MVAEKIKSIVDSRGIKYIAISQATGVPIDALSRSFNGKRKLLADEMIAICDYLGLGMSDVREAQTNLHN